MRIASYADALQYLYGFADFERTGMFARDPEENLRRMLALLRPLGDPHLAYATTHIAGTKGKGSTALLIAAALTASGVRTGLYTQPDLHTFRERIQIDGTLITEDGVVAILNDLAAIVAGLPEEDRAQLITFELGTALAFLAFARAGVQHAVIEVGVGGRLDPTNVVAPLVGVITAISLDHTAILGATIPEIAREKAGIIKPGMAVVTSAQDPAALAVIAATCQERGASLARVGPMGSDAAYRYAPAYDAAPPRRITSAAEWSPPPFNITNPSGARHVQIGLLGGHQRENAAAALAALDALRARGVPVTAMGIADGFGAARWPGRMEVVGERPWVVIDGAHNADSMQRLMDALDAEFAFHRLFVVLGMMRDKDRAGIAAALAGMRDRLALIGATAAEAHRALPPAELAAFLAAYTLPATAIADPGEAIAAVLSQAAPDDLVVVTGSLYLAGAALRWCHAHLAGPLAARIAIAGDDHHTG